MSPSLADEPREHPIRASRRVFRGRVWDVVSQTVELPSGDTVVRDYVDHPGAVAVMALNDNGEVYLVRQYRHPVRRDLWEPPAGLMDMDGESPQAAAARELWEEADLVATQWHVLADYATSPGGSSEGIRIYLARGLSAVPESDRFTRQAEEATMVGRWVALDQVLEAGAAGDLWGPTTLVGAFTLDYARRTQWTSLRPADAPWDYEPGIAGRRDT